MGLIKGDGKRRSKGLILAGQNTILKLYPLPTKQKLKYVYLSNDKDLKDSIEKVVFSSNIQAQEAMIRFNRHNVHSVTEKMIVKTVRRKEVYCVTVPEYETSITNKNLAKLVGYKSSMTGYRRNIKWVKSGFIEKNNRKEKLSYMADRPLVYVTRNNVIFKILANEYFINDKKFGRKIIEDKSSYVSFVDNSLFNEWF